MTRLANFCTLSSCHCWVMLSEVDQAGDEYLIGCTPSSNLLNIYIYSPYVAAWTVLESCFVLSSLSSIVLRNLVDPIGWKR